MTSVAITSMLILVSIKLKKIIETIRTLVFNINSKANHYIFIFQNLNI